MKTKVTLVNNHNDWSEKRRYKINAVVRHNDVDWQNTTGINSEPGVGSDWVSFSNGIEQIITDISSTATLTGWSSIDRIAIFTIKTGKSVLVNFLVEGTSNADNAQIELPYTSFINAQNTALSETDLGRNFSLVTVSSNILEVTSNITSDAFPILGFKRITGQISFITT